MSQLEVSLYDLHVDARDTVAAVLDAGVYTAGSHALLTVLRTAASGVPMSARAEHDDSVNQLAPVSVSTVDSALATLASAGLVEARTVWDEAGTDAYLSEGRTLTAVRVPVPFTASVHDGDAADRIRQLPTVSTSWYLVAAVGDIVRELVGVTSVPVEHLAWSAEAGGVAEHLTSWVVEVEGFGASRCDAQCSACRRRWYAEAGSWRFRSEGGGPGWEYDDAYGFDGATIVCPLCTVGRIGFAIS